MANYNTFIIVNCKTRNPVLVTSSARKADKVLFVGFRVEIWNDNKKIETVYTSSKKRLVPYIQQEKEYIRKKQEYATLKNQRQKYAKGGVICSSLQEE